MARTSVTIVKNDFPEAIAKGVEGAKRAKEEAIKRVADHARENVAVLTGETRDSITETDEGVIVGGAALYLEFGTRKMAAQPFLIQGVDEADDVAIEFLSAIFGK
jgi:hypothetical protein